MKAIYNYRSKLFEGSFVSPLGANPFVMTFMTPSSLAASTCALSRNKSKKPYLSPNALHLIIPLVFLQKNLLMFHFHAKNFAPYTQLDPVLRFSFFVNFLRNFLFS